jgi:leucyl aminopeptidase
MNFINDYDGKESAKAQVKILAAFQKKTDDGISATLSGWPKEIAEYFHNIKISGSFKAANGEVFSFNCPQGESYIALGLGEKKKVKSEQLRKAISKVFKAAQSAKAESISFDADQLNTIRSIDETTYIISEAIQMSAYTFDKYLSKKKENSVKKVIILSKDKKAKIKNQKALDRADHITHAINFSRDMVNEVPNVQNSEAYAKMIAADVKKNLKATSVTTKILDKKQIEKENMRLFLSVNAGSGYEPRLVHLTYTPKKVTKNTKHIALVGKGLVFDTGGYSLKPGASMVNMKFDMAGSATVYGAFRAAVLQDSPYKLTCILAITDNAVNSFATMPDSVVKGRNGTTVEILNTDAEGRLALADALDYACDLGPDVILDAATLTGACLVALGSEVAAILSNDNKLVDKLKKSAATTDEYVWQMPIIDEWRQEMKSNIADLQNIGKGRFAGTATAAAFLENFIKNDISWAHFDIAGIGDSQKHLPYCPTKGGSGLIIRTMADFMVNGKI